MSKNQLESHVVHQYTQAALDIGDAVSYLYMGEPVGFEEKLASWEHWEREFANQGYQPLSIDTLVRCGGYDEDITPFLKKREVGKDPILHSAIFREKYGKKPVEDVANVQGKMVGNHFEGTWTCPTTEDPTEKDK